MLLGHRMFCRRQFLLRLVCALLVGCCSVANFSCQSYVQDVVKPLDLINDADLSHESQLPVLFSSLGGYLGYFMRGTTAYACTLSDEFVTVEGVSRNSVDADFLQCDRGEPLPTIMNFSWGRLGGLRFHAENLIIRSAVIRFSQESQRQQCLYLGWFYLALVDHYQALWFGLSPRVGGGIISGGPFIPTVQIHDSALVKFTNALRFAQTGYERRLVNSFIARVHLLEGRYQRALEAAAIGMQAGDSAFSALYAASALNTWSDFAGRSNHQIIPDERFRRYVEAEPAEAGRILLEQGQRPSSSRIVPYFIQAKYLDENSPIALMTWQETSLITAEAHVRSGNNAAALVEINKVRAAVPPVVVAQRTVKLELRTATNLDSIYIERDKQLFATGMRLADQRRFNRWHFPPSVAAIAWYFLPIAQNERNTNPNLPRN